MGILEERCPRCGRQMAPGALCSCSTNHHLDKSGNFVSARTSPASSNISGYCYKHDTDYTGRCPWCPVEAVIPPEIIKKFDEAKAAYAAAGNVLETKAADVVECDVCHGSGKNFAHQLWPGSPCRVCSGTGQIGEVLELKHEWALTTLDFGGVHFERMIGGVRVSMRLPDGAAISEEFTSEEFYEFMYRRFQANEGHAWEMWLFLAAIAWIFVAGIAAFLSGV